ncbi:unnamed protein product, partial [Didymodactylos carnosus]
LGPDIMLQLFSHILFERRILFVSSKLFHLTACACGCLHLIFPMHWQSIFVPVLPSSMSWLSQCTVPYIIGVHTSIFSTLNISELGDVVCVNIDERTIETQYDDLSRIPKHLHRSMKKGVQHSEKLHGDGLAKVFLRAMAFNIGTYSNGFILKDDTLDFDRDQYLRQYENTPIHEYMSAIAHTQMFEQFSRYRTDSLTTAFDDEFDIEVKNIQQLQQNKKANPIIEQVQNRAEKLGTVINRAGQRVVNEASTVKNNLASLDINDVMRRNEQKGINSLSNGKSDLQQQHLSIPKPLQSSTPDLLDEKSIPYERFGSTGNVNFGATYTSMHEPPSSTSDSSGASSPDLKRKQENLITIDTQPHTLAANTTTTAFNSLLPSPVELNVINVTNNRSLHQQTARPVVHSSIKQLQTELKNKVQNFDGKRIDPKEEYGSQGENLIKKLVRQFDPLDDMASGYATMMTGESLPVSPYFRKKSDLFSSSSTPVTFRNESNSSPSVFHPSICEIPSNRVNYILQNIRSTYGTTPLQTVKITPPSSSFARHISPQPTPNLMNFSPRYPSIQPYRTQKQQQTFSETQSSLFDPLLPTT